MSDLAVKGSSSTPWEKVTGVPVKFAKENQAVATAGVGGAIVSAKMIADQSAVGAMAVKKGLVPVAGIALAGGGALLIHDAFTNIKKDSTKESLVKTGAGFAMMATGSEVVGRSYGIQSLQVLTATSKAAIAKSATIGYGAASIATAGGAVYAVQDMKKNGINIMNSAVLTGTATVSTAALAKAILKASPESPAVQAAGNFVMSKGGQSVAGIGLGVTSYALAKDAVQAYKKDDGWKALGLGVGSIASAGTAAHLLGNASGVASLSNIGQKAIQNPVLTGALVATTIGAGALYAYATKDEAAPKK